MIGSMIKYKSLLKKFNYRANSRYTYSSGQSQILTVKGSVVGRTEIL